MRLLSLLLLALALDAGECRYFFYYNANLNGNIGGISGANNLCRTAASTSTLRAISSRSASFMALLNHSSFSVSDFGDSQEPVQLASGVQIFSSFSAMMATNSVPAQPVAIDENGM